jgi:two-component system, OmpR family, sensor histidine kinase VicK
LVTQPTRREKTEVIYGMENIINITLNRFSLTKYRIDSCIDKSNPKTIITTEAIVNGIIDHNKRGIKSRVITEVTKDNILYCRELMKLSIELRHLDDIKGNFSISDGAMYQATAMGDFSVASILDNNHNSSTINKEKEEEHLQPITKAAGIETETILSNVRAFVSQQQYFFDTLWMKAIPAKQRIKEIEEGAKREFIDTIREPKEIEKLLFQLLKSASEEILIINPAGSSFLLSKLDGIMQLLSEAAERAVNIRILIDREEEDDSLKELVQELRPRLEQEGKGGVRERQQNQKHHRIHIQYLNKPKYSKVTTIVVDNEFSITIEIKDDDNNNKNKSFSESIGMATYSNSQSTVLSYASIFETLWIQAELKPQT